MLFTALSYAQVGINTNTPNASSALEIESTTGGILIPRLTQTQRDAITEPATGLMIYQTNQTAGFYFWDGAAWTKIDGVAGPQGTDGADGNDGLQGETGLAGPAGADGTNGNDGAAGPAGPAGADGNDGATGATGADGAAGADGPAGIQGAQGEAGPQGIQGIQGETGIAGPQGETGSNSGGFKTINEIFNERILVQYASSVNGSVSNINSDNIIVNFFTNVDPYNITNISFSCYDINGNLLNLYVEELRYRRDTWYSTSRDFTKIETFYYNSTAPSRSYNVVTSTNGGGTPEAKGDFKVWSDGIIDRIDYLIENSNNGNTNFQSNRNPRLIIYNFD